MTGINKANNFQKFFEQFGGLELFPFQFRNLLQLLNNQLWWDSSVEKVNKGAFKNGKCQLLKIARSRYIATLIRS